MKKILIFLFSTSLFSQRIDINNNFNYNFIHSQILLNKIETDYSLNIKPISAINEFEFIVENQFKSILSNKKNNIIVKTLGIDYFIEYNTKHPYNRNNGTMIPNRGYQHIISPGFYIKLGPISMKFKPEHHYSQNLDFDGFWEGHYDVIWSKRYKLWNQIDMPERHGFKNHNKTTLGQSSIRLNWKNLSIGLSSENLWWGPSTRNSIMMSNHAQGFKHITLNTIKPIKTKIGNFEWQLISARLQQSGFKPAGYNRTYAGTNIYVPKTNQYLENDDWRYLQALIVSYSPKWIDGLSLGLIRWAQMYSALVKGKYTWIKGKPTYFPVFSYLFRKNNSNVDVEMQTNEAIGIFINWNWKEAKSRFYFEFHHNDSKINLRDLFLDSDHSRAATVGLEKFFEINKNDFLLKWEWTQMEQTASRLIRNAGSWYQHYNVLDGYTNNGEVLGSSIGPGSNSHYFSISKVNPKSNTGLAIEIIDHDNDFFHEAFASAGDFRRYWKDLNFHLNYDILLNNLKLSSTLVYIKSFNYQWELDDYAEPYYHPGRDIDNFHFNIKLTYFGNW